MRTTVNTRERADMLRTIAIFQGCTDKQLSHLAVQLGEVELDTGDVLMRENEPGTASYVIVDGRAAVTVQGVEVNQLRSGDLCGEMALLDNTPRCATITAMVPLRALVIPGTEFDEIVREPWMARRVLRTIVERLRAADGGVAF
jgi:CRP-like cAMP-binding protein